MYTVFIELPMRCYNNNAMWEGVYSYDFGCY